MHTPRRLSVLLAFILIFIFASGCSRCHGRKITGTGGGGGNAAPTVNITEPLVSATLTIGSTITIKYVDDDPDDIALTDTTILKIGGAKTVLVNDAPELDGTEQTVAWDTTGYSAGDYRIEVKTSDGHKTVKDTSVAIITLADRGSSGGGGNATDGFGTASGLTDEKALAVATFPDGSYVTGGTFIKKGGATSLTFGAGETNATAASITGISAGEAFLARYNSDGTLAWVRTTKTIVGSTVGENNIHAVAVLDDGSIACVGDVGAHLNGAQMILNDGQADAQTLTFAPNGVIGQPIFVALYSGAGNLIWARRIDTTSGSFAPRILNITAIPSSAPSARLTSDGSSPANPAILVGGYVGGTTVFNIGEATETTIPLGNSTQLCAARFEFDGSLTFVKTGQPSDSKFHVAHSISAFPDGSFVMAGKRGGSMTLGAGEPNATTLSSGTDIFIAKFNNNGTLAWARNFVQSSLGSVSSDFATAAACGDGTTAFTGYVTNFTGGGFPATFTFGAGEANQTSIIIDNEDTLINARFNGDGTLIFAKRAAGSMVQILDGGTRVSTFSDGSFVTTGFTSLNSTIFGTGEANQTTLTTNGGNAAWIARYNSNGTLAWVRGGGHGAFGGTNVSAVSLAVAAFGDGRCVAAGYQFGSNGQTIDYNFGGPAVVTAQGTGSKDMFLLRIAQ